LYDLYLHEFNRDGDCWCCPELDYDSDETTYVHHAYDRREDYEEGWRKPH
jgi:hypothetical protein